MNQAVDSQARKGKRGLYSKFCLIQYVESTTASSGVIHDAVVTMMWREQFVEWAATAAGGLVPRTQALVKWVELQKVENNPLVDVKGPGPHEFADAQQNSRGS